MQDEVDGIPIARFHYHPCTNGILHLAIIIILSLSKVKYSVVTDIVTH